MSEFKENTHEEEPKERIERLQQKVWDNLRNSGLLQQILNQSQHDDDPSKYVGVEFWTDIGASQVDYRTKMWLKINIKHIEHRQPVTPKLYRLTKDPTEQKRISEQIWDGITEEDLRFIAKFKSDDYYSRDQDHGLFQGQSQTIRVLHPAIEAGKFTVELIPDHAQYCFVPKNDKI